MMMMIWYGIMHVIEAYDISLAQRGQPSFPFVLIKKVYRIESLGALSKEKLFHLVADLDFETRV